MTRRNVRTTLVAGLIVPALALAGCSQGDNGQNVKNDAITQVAQPPEDGVMRYHYANEHERQYGDLFLPTDKKHDGPVPLVVFIHGGGWMEKSDARSTNPFSRDLASRGVAVWNIEYRGIGKQGEPGPGGWPETYKDVAAAMDYIPMLAAKSSVELDLNKVTVAGISAGGNLSAWACARAALPAGAPGSKPKFENDSCVGIAGVYDLKLAYEQHDHYVKTLLGGTPDEVPDHYRLSSPAENINKKARVVVLHGRNDHTVNVDEATTYAKDARAKGQQVDVHLLDDADHMSWADMKGPQWTLARKHILEQVGIQV